MACGVVLPENVHVDKMWVRPLRARTHHERCSMLAFFCFKLIHLCLGKNGSIHHVVEVMKFKSGYLILHFLQKAIVKTTPLFPISGGIVRGILCKVVEGVHILHHSLFPCFRFKNSIHLISITPSRMWKAHKEEGNSSQVKR